MPRPLCVGCHVEMRVEEIGVTVLEEARALAQGEEEQGPYKLWQADLFACPRCGRQIVARYADRPTPYYAPGFAEELDHARETGKLYVMHEYLGEEDEEIASDLLGDLLSDERVSAPGEEE